MKLFLKILAMTLYLFKIKSVETISEQRNYHGARVKMLAQIKNTKTPFDVDMGVGDIIIPKDADKKTTNPTS